MPAPASSAAADTQSPEAGSREFAEREQTALDFVEAFLGSIYADGANADGSAKLVDRDPRAWFEGFMSYLAEGTDTYEFCMEEYGRALTWDEEADGPYWGEGNPSTLFDAATVLSSEGDTVRIAVRGWEDNSGLPADFRESVQPDFFVMTVVLNESNEVIDFRNEAS